MRLPPLKLRRGDRESWTRAATAEARVAKRARIVLLAAEGMSNRDIAELVDLHYNQVGMWRQRYAEFGLAGLDDLERSGRPPVYDHDDVLLLVKQPTGRAVPLDLRRPSPEGRVSHNDLGAEPLVDRFTSL
jgi:hypothetical protein